MRRDTQTGLVYFYAKIDAFVLVQNVLFFNNNYQRNGVVRYKSCLNNKVIITR